MHAHDASPPAALVEGLAARLAPLLEARGLTVALERGGTIRVSNPAGGVTDPLGRALSPGLNQRIAIADHDGAPWFFWLWPGPERDSPPELEPMVRLEEVAEAARRIAAVLRVGEPDGATR